MYSVLTKMQGKRQVFASMINHFRHIIMLRRFGRAHVDDGVSTTPQGGLAIRCPACPEPGRNLPRGWQEAGPDTRYAHADSLRSALLITLQLSISEVRCSRCELPPCQRSPFKRGAKSAAGRWVGLLRQEGTLPEICELICERG